MSESLTKSEFQRIKKHAQLLISAAIDIAGSTEPEKILELLCAVADAESCIREACAYIQGINDGYAAGREDGFL